MTDGFGDAGGGWVRGFFGKGEEENHLAAELAAELMAGGEGGEDFADGTAEKFFVELGELAGEDDGLGGAKECGEVAKGFEDAVRSFVEDVGLGRAWEGFECAAAGSGL